MTRFIDRTGQTFGTITLTRPTARRAAHGHTIWEASCECGATVQVSTSNLLQVLTCGDRTAHPLDPDRALSYSRAHKLLRRDLGRASEHPCSTDGCTERGGEWAFKGAPGGWSTDTSQYEALCYSHHQAADRAARVAVAS